MNRFCYLVGAVLIQRGEFVVGHVELTKVIATSHNLSCPRLCWSLG